MTPRTTIVAFGLSGFAQNVVGTCIGVHLFAFYTDVAGLAPLWVSAGLAVATVWDAVFGLFVGRVSDATRSRAGRRRPYILAGALPAGLGLVMLLSPPEALRGDELGIYFTLALLVLFTATTLTQVPALSLLPELTPGHHERTRLAAARELFGNLGDLVGLLLPIVVLIAAGANDASTARSAFGTAALAGGALATLALFSTALGTREKPAPCAPSAAPLRGAVRALREDRALRTLLLAAFLGALSFAFSQAMVLYVLEHVMRESDPAVHLAAFVTNVVAAILSYPFWTRLSRRFGKPATFRAGLVLSSFAFGSVFFAGPGSHVLLFSVMAFSGAANVGFWMMLQSLAADVADRDSLRHGERREGLHAGLSILARKAAFALAAAGTGIGLTLVGHRAGAAPSEDVVAGMKLLFALPPTALVLLALAVFRGFPSAGPPVEDTLPAPPAEIAAPPRRATAGAAIART